LDLVLFKPDGELFRSYRFDHAAGYDWSPTERQIAVCRAKPAAEMAESSCLTDISVLDVQTGQQHKVFDGGSHFRWARFDSSLYILDNSEKVFRYDPRSNTVEETLLRNIDFSDDGIYYLHFLPVIPDIGIIRRVDNQDVTPVFKLTVKKYFEEHKLNNTYNASSVTWVTGHTFTFLDDNVANSYLYDVDSDSIIASSDGRLIGVTNGEGIFQDSKTRTMSLRKVVMPTHSVK
jgi:hypothetical protein